MILRKIRLEDFGLYAGSAEIDLVPRTVKGRQNPIVLIGGKNGAGKTTVLEAVRLALYGRRALGTRVGLSEYENHLRERINRDSTSARAAVELEFDYSEAGFVHRYRVRREWEVRGKAVAEELSLEKDGSIVTAVPRDEWHMFLQELIPPGVSQLFFFDGEKIQQIASDDDNEQMADAVRSLLGIELVGRLRTDIALFIGRHEGGAGDGVAAKVNDVVMQLNTNAKRIDELNGEVAELMSFRDSQARVAERIRRRFVAEGGEEAMARNSIESERESVKKEISRGEHELKELANGLLPFAMAPKLIAGFKNALLAENSSSVAPSVAALRAAISSWKRNETPDREARWTDKHWSDLRRFVQQQARTPSGSKSAVAFAGLGDGTAALARLNEIEGVVRPRAETLLRRLESLARRERELEKKLARADNAAAGAMLDELRLADQKLGTTEATLKTRQAELDLVRGQRVTMERERVRMLEEQSAAANASDRVDLAGRTAQVLADYEHRLLEHKLVQLKSEFVRCFGYLARKPGLIGDIRIDPVTFRTTLLDQDGNEVRKDELSAGEKQVYAIAMLWALARTSGRPLPMIIDTPLARLDSEHRANLMERYFPAASHQVIMLSTDTEVDATQIERLRPSISHSYRLDYDPVSRRTSVCRGYFEVPEVREDARALQQA
ncbi:DNA sulfur modification protein DndD [Bradyrhizobium sp. NDS-1]|uniref:DNA sulfur modification protein DndD n=1 Tax=Bradyrhizobium sp. NDS-1 TaxID=3080014 RepID=UPI00293EDEC4|nr:DNA sulfur modification protein DndD [Bradyrhizobium sp. NDS-1]WOH75545.1 DNA sulfur modification protein DndD [Bradyrhizobium sp. NDS-1]